MATRDAQQAPMLKLALCSISPRREVTLSAAVSLLRTQAAIISSQTPMMTDMYFVHSLNDALNEAWRMEGAHGALICDGTIGFDVAFLERALASEHHLIAGTYPMPLIDWERVKSRPAGKDPRTWGHVPNTEPSPVATAGGPYVPIQGAKHLGLLWVRREALVDIARRHPGIVSKDGTHAAFAMEGVYDGKRCTAPQRLFDLWGGPVVADTQSTCNSSGPVEFGGCVGERKVLR
jgi:hypothetical protein